MVIKDDTLISVHKSDLSKDGILYIPDDVTVIGEKASNNIKQILKKIVFDDECNISIIKENAFRKCTALTDVIFCKRVEVIGEDAFSDCTALRKVVFPTALKEIHNSAFRNCISLREIKLPDSITKIGQCAFCVTGISHLLIPQNCTEIGASAFWHCDYLTEVTILSPMKILEVGMFRYCTGLKIVTLPDTITTIKADAFSECSNLSKINMPQNLESIHSSAFYRTANLKQITLPPFLKEVKKYAFKASGINLITMGSFVTSLEKGAFRSCHSLEFVDLSLTKLTKVNQNLFCDCINLKRVLLPKKVRLICDEAFMNCHRLESLTIHPKTEIEPDAFKLCDNLKEIKEFKK